MHDTLMTAHKPSVHETFESGCGQKHGMLAPPDPQIYGTQLGHSKSPSITQTEERGPQAPENARLRLYISATLANDTAPAVWLNSGWTLPLGQGLRPDITMVWARASSGYVPQRRKCHLGRASRALRCGTPVAKVLAHDGIGQLFACRGGSHKGDMTVCDVTPTIH